MVSGGFPQFLGFWGRPPGPLVYPPLASCELIGPSFRCLGSPLASFRIRLPDLLTCHPPEMMPPPADKFSDPSLSPLPTRLGIEHVARRPCCDDFAFPTTITAWLTSLASVWQHDQQNIGISLTSQSVFCKLYWTKVLKSIDAMTKWYASVQYCSAVHKIGATFRRYRIVVFNCEE